MGGGEGWDGGKGYSPLKGGERMSPRILTSGKKLQTFKNLDCSQNFSPVLWLCRASPEQIPALEIPKLKGFQEIINPFSPSPNMKSSLMENICLICDAIMLFDTWLQAYSKRRGLLNIL